jgi:hypothetical protein
MKQYHITFYADRNDEEIELEITGTVSPYVYAKTNCLPENAHPDEGSEVEITSIKDGGMAWKGTLTPTETEVVEEMLLQSSQDDDVDEPEWDDGRDFGLEEREGYFDPEYDIFIPDDE